MTNLPKRFEIQKKSKFLAEIRQFFCDEGVLEVDTPLAYTHPVTDPYIDVFAIQTQSGKRFLQSSPEYAMKQLLAEYKVSIYQICKAFRDDPSARYHHHEFMMLEWYKVGFDDWQLMGELEKLITTLDPEAEFIYISYQSLFEKYIDINPHQASSSKLLALVTQHIGEVVGLKDLTYNDCLDLLFTHLIEPKLADYNEFVFIYHYPASQSALAKKVLDKEKQQVSARFELFCKGIELANGYNELTNAHQLKAQFEAEISLRDKLGLKQVEIDEALLSCIEKLPECAGVAVGLDRLFMCLLGKKKISDVSFCI
ncbi:EF-P lysine aminoacylase EpmA [Fangia hongkongensis]|uniref:EF-P lysine aminoacylase EpmA n=1 Tax=Fangia hongkongensis TaxID=270495 RepID=UPI00037CEFE8|nr:EF-P lysine aminoacylase EpmA [Fangia hongkongensis]MBK2123721.1 EF-P lysine aminoacylase GenX [Fangia hongkongensis]